MSMKKDIVDQIKHNQDLKNRLCYDLKLSHVTLQRWLSNNSDNLTKYHTLKIIASELGHEVTELVENVEV